ncbi:MAG: DnaA regulatory inactivator Hda [Candidatus Accumulibacter sp.]|nr:DnaA regulatory inactivator Hda [Accumulibacter sp.]
MRQLILDLLPESPPAFENFVPGRNIEALTGLVAWLLPDNRETLFGLWGETGAGKSHLLRACAASYHDAHDDASLDDLPTDDGFCAVDHLEALDGQGQIRLFNAINRLRASGGRLLTASSAPPRQLALREDLRSRLASGLVHRLHALSDAEKLAALEEQAAQRGLALPNEALPYLIRRVPRDMRTLSALLAAIDRYSLEHKRPVTLPLLREVLQTASHP